MHRTIRRRPIVSGDADNGTSYLDGTRPVTWLAGRTAELAQLDRHACAVAAGRPCTVLVEGAPGVGRTALLRRFSAEHDATIWWTCCARTEHDLDYGLVAQLYRHLARSAQQQHPWSEWVPPSVPVADVGLELLRAIESIQQIGPLTIVVDDAQWMDDPSFAVLGYVLRRLTCGRVLVVFAMHSPGPADRDVCDALRALAEDREWSAVLRLGGLATDDIHDLAEHVGTPVSMPVASRLGDYVGGNPRHVLDVLRRLGPDERACAARTFPLPDAVAGHARRFIAGLEAPAVRLLGALAVLAECHPLAVVADVAGVPDATGHLGALVAGEYVRWWPQAAGTPVGIGGRLRRDAVYRSLDPELRRQLHARVATRTDRLTALDHRLAATTGPDDELADALAAASAEPAVAADGDRATTFLLCAAELTTDRNRRDHRLSRAAAALACAWRWNQLAELAPRITECPPSPLRSLALGALAHRRGQLSLAESLLAETLGTPADDPLRPVLVRAWLRIAASCARHDQGRLEGVIARWVLAEPGIDLATRQQAACHAADADGRCNDGPVTALHTLRRLLPTRAGDQPGLLPLVVQGRWLARAGRLTEAATTLLAADRRLPDDSAADLLPVLHADLAFTQHLLGETAVATEFAELAVTEADRRGSPATRSLAYATAACIAAQSNRLARATELMLSARRWHSGGMHHAALAAATIAQVNADYPAMLAALRPVLDLPVTDGNARHCQLWWRPLQAEALIGTGRLPEAAEAVRWLVELAKRTPALRTAASWLRGWLAERLGDHGEARLRYEAAITAPHEPDDIPLHRARLDHAYGLLLLSRGSRRAAVAHLRAAFECYSRLDAQPFAERCATDLADSGPHGTTGHPDGPLAALSAKEHQVAHLVAAGLTNQQVAKEIYISVKTVEFHLGNIFTKLGITSRKDLGTLIAGHTGDLAPRRLPATGPEQADDDQGRANSSISLMATSGGVPPV